MEPLTMIVSALTAGATAALKPTAESIIKDAYQGIKSFILGKYKKINLEPIEQKPESESKRESLKEDLVDAGADKDQELLERIARLIEVIEKSPAATSAAASIGIDIKKVKAGNLNVKGSHSEGATTINVTDSEFRDDINIEGIIAGAGKTKENPQ